MYPIFDLILLLGLSVDVPDVVVNTPRIKIQQTHNARRKQTFPVYSSRAQGVNHRWLQIAAHPFLHFFMIYI